MLHLTKYEHKGFSECIDSDDRNFSSVGFTEELFVKRSELITLD